MTEIAKGKSASRLTKAVRLYGQNDLRLEEFPLPEPGDDEILAEVVSDSICMSTHKAALQGAAHKRVPADIATHPTIVGHEFCGNILAVGAKWQRQFQPGRKFAIQPALNYQGSLDAPGYSYHYIGGAATYIVIPNEVMEMNCLLDYAGDAYFHGSLAEPMSCLIGAFHACYHAGDSGYTHKMGIRPGGNLAILAGAGPMGLGAIDYAIHGDLKPRLLVVTDIDTARLERAGTIHTISAAAEQGVDLHYVNTKALSNPDEYLLSLTGGAGFDEVFVMAPVKPVVEQGDRLLAKDGCLNFFAGPTDPAFAASLNFYNVHYGGTHVVGTSGGNTADMVEALGLMGKGRLNPAAMITHVGGLNCVPDTTLRLPEIPGGKKLIYTHIEMELTALADLRAKGKTDQLAAELAEIVEAHNGLWSLAAEQHLLARAKKV